MYAWGWNSLENSAEIVQLCLRMRSQKNTSFMFSHKTLENTSWTPCFEAENFNFPGWHWTLMKGKACAPVRESTWMSPDWEHRRNKQEPMRGRARFLQRSYEVYGSCLEFARQRKRDNELKKQWRQKWGRKSWRGEEETRSGGDMDTGQRVSVLWTSDLQAAELLCVCVGRVSLTASASFLPSFSPACHHYTSLCSLQVSHSSFPQVISSNSERWRDEEHQILL